MSKFHNFNHTKQTAGSKWVIGIDEAGRGPLAGPVVVAGVKISVKRKAQSEKLLNGIKDSKKLTAKQREEWFRVLTAHPQIEWAAAKISPKMIDRLNIAKAANLGAWRVYNKLIRSSSTNYELNTNIRITNSIGEARRTLLDGGLKLPQFIPHITIIKGDERVPAIAAASIIAKVTRDRLMARLHKKYPQYGFERHKGYGTKLHREVLRKHSFCPEHRLSFLRKII